MFYSRLEAKQVLLDLILEISAEESRNGAPNEEHIKDYLKAVLSETEEGD